MIFFNLGSFFFPFLSIIIVVVIFCVISFLFKGSKNIIFSVVSYFISHCFVCGSVCDPYVLGW